MSSPHYMKEIHKTILIAALIILAVFIISQVQKYQKATAIQQLHELAKLSRPQAEAKSINCLAKNGLPDPGCTPGAVFSDATKDQVCKNGYTKTVRNVSTGLKKKVYFEYGVETRGKGEYEVDHFISLALGGSNDITNLWPESAEPWPGFHEKDKVENYLYALMCSGVISLTESQMLVSWQWPGVYELLRQSERRL